MVKISSDLKNFKLTHVTPRGRQLPFSRAGKTLSRGPDQQLQRRQRVYQYLGVQQALVLVQSIRKRSRFITSLLKNIIFRPSGH
jgi:hypothetical protein